MCARRLWNDPTGLCCDLPDGHDGAHAYHASDAPDRHDKTEAVQG